MNMRKKMGMFIALITIFSITVTAQVTTSSMNGFVKNNSGGVLTGSTVKLTHTPTGTTYQTATGKDGRYTLVNLIPGGPYTIEISNVGFTNYTEPNITLPLGENLTVDATLSTSATVLTDVVITTTGTAKKKTGASTSISKAQIAALPTLSRSLSDYTRLTPQANGNSFGGTNNRFNNITIDGAVNNDLFGLSGSGTPGGSAGTTPISIDAIQEIQVVLAPFDVSYGNFTGAGINAVTRSGTNKIEGSVYYFMRNQSTIGSDPVTKIKSAEFSDKQYGFRVGGPIIKNKLFFFLNGEQTERTSPLLYNAGENSSLLTTQEAQELKDTLMRRYSYDAGSIDNSFKVATKSDKAFGRIDWNINQKHRLTIRHNYIKAYDDNISRSPTLFRFGNNAYRFTNKQNITVMELRSRFNSTFSNNLIVGRHEIRDFRSTYGSLFPSVEITKGSGLVQFGTERSSVANQLDQDIFEVTDNFKIFKGKHVFTIGTHNEFFKIRNLFVNNFNGRWRFNSLEDFYDNIPSRVEANYAADKTNTDPAAKFNAYQLGFYIQDEIQFNNKFKLTYGIRADLPVVNSTPPYNRVVDSVFKGAYSTSTVPKKELLWAPRVGFNWDVEGNRSIVLRGGAGVFSGRLPFVWISNQFTNSGLLTKSLNLSGNAINGGNGFNPDPLAQSSLGAGVNTFEVNLIDKNFKMPQVMRFSLGIDKKLPWGLNLSIDGLYSKTLNNIYYRNINFKPLTGFVDPVYNNGYDSRAAFTSSSARNISNDMTFALLLDNTSKGYTYNLGFTLNKTTKHLFAQVGYNYNKAKDINSGLSSTALSNWEFVIVAGDPNTPPLTTSAHQLQHRVTGVISLNFDYAKNYKTSVGFFYNGISGQPFTYLVNGDLNNDGRINNDLLYVPGAPEEITFVDRIVTSQGVTTVVSTAAEQKQQFLDFVNNDQYLKTRKGKYAERNGAKNPWEHVIDMRVAQDFYINVGGNKHDLQLTLDIFNLTNLINKDWGRQFSVGNQAYTVLTTVNRTSGQYAGKGYNFTPGPAYAPTFGSRWQGQIGFRYSFN